MKANLTSKSALLLLTLLSARKQYTEDYWLFYSKNWEGEWLISILIWFLWDWTTKGIYFCYFIFNYNENLLFDPYVFNMSVIIIFSQNLNQPLFDICWSIGKKKHMSISIKNQRKITLINYITKTTFNLLSNCQQVRTRKGGWFQKMSVILLYFGEAK